jgi:hypothetical protein
MRQQFYRNLGGKFREESLGCGAYFHRKLLGRGTAAGDFNNDGLPDMAVTHLCDQTAVLLNRSERCGRWVGIELVGRRTSRGGGNAKIWLTASGYTQYHELVAGGAYLSASDARVLFGLGSGRPGSSGSITAKVAGEGEDAGEGGFAVVTELRFRWPSGTEQTLRNLPADRYHLVIEPVR